ncbi:MAG: DUF6485 family protein [Candidatus Bathyarchaeia archaeon]
MQKAKQCPNLEANLRSCGCTYTQCDKKGRCCKCIRFHRERNELPGCLFSPELEKTYDRSAENFTPTRG